jgi:hypothetical protein
MGNSSLFVPDPEDNWWPQDLGRPSATGSQNNVRYAYFANSRRLAVKTGSEVWVYDTQDHNIGGFSQQQGYGGTITFSSQFGTVQLSRLPVVSRNGQPMAAPTPPPPVAAPFGMSPLPPNAGSSDVISALEKLGDLKSKGILTESEFATKKAELLSRL